MERIPRGFIFAIIGSRDFTDYNFLSTALDNIIDSNKTDYVKGFVSGGAKGADSLGEMYANNKGLPITIFRPDWDRYGKRAGFIRNTTIIETADCVVVFWDGVSRGTLDSLNKAKDMNKEIYLYKYKSNEFEYIKTNK